MKFDGTDPEVLDLLQDSFVQDCTNDDECVIRVLTRQSHRYVYVSANSKQLLGVDPATQLGKSCFEFISPAKTPWVRELMLEAMERPIVSWYSTGHFDNPSWVRTESKPIGNFIVGKLRLEPDDGRQREHFEELVA